MGNEIEKKSYFSFTVILRYLGASSCDYFVDNLQKKKMYVGIWVGLFGAVRQCLNLVSRKESLVHNYGARGPKFSPHF